MFSKPFVGVFALLLFSVFSGSAHAGKDDELPSPELKVFLKRESDTRNLYWNHLFDSLGPRLGVGLRFSAQAIVDAFGTIDVATVDLGSANPIVKLSERPGIVDDSAIFYHAYVSEEVKRGRALLKGVVVNAYGALSRNPLASKDHLSWEYMLASQGYLVYVLNLPGVQEYGDEHSLIQRKNGGVLATVKEIAFFVNLLKFHLQDPKGNSPALSDLIKKDTPFFFEGSSFGGYLGLLIATHPEDSFQEQQKLRIRALFDGIISNFPLSDVKEDAESGTSDGRSRKEGLNRLASQDVSSVDANDWQANAYSSLRPLHHDGDNEILSPLKRAHLLEKPVLLTHGLQDTNVSPQQSFRFVGEAIRFGKGYLISQLYSQVDGHQDPIGHSFFQDYYEAKFRFMDAVRYEKLFNHGKIFELSQSEQKKAKDILSAAWFLFRAQHKELLFPHQRYGFLALKKLKSQIHVPLFEFEKFWEEFKQENWREFLHAILFLKIHNTRANMGLPLDDQRASLVGLLNGMGIPHLRTEKEYRLELPPPEYPTLSDYFGSVQPDNPNFARYKAIMDFLGDYEDSKFNEPGVSKKGREQYKKLEESLKERVRALIEGKRSGGQVLFDHIDSDYLKSDPL